MTTTTNTPFKTVKITFTILKLTGILCANNPTSSNSQSRKIRNPLKKRAIPRAPINAPPTAAVVSFSRRVISNRNLISTHIPSYPITRPTSTFGFVSRYVASWSGDEEHNSYNGTIAQNPCTITITRLLRQNATGEFTPETVDIRIGLVAGQEMIFLGVARCRVMGSTRGEIETKLQVRRLANPKSGSKKATVGFQNSKNVRYTIDDNSELSVKMTVVEEDESGRETVLHHEKPEKANPVRPVTPISLENITLEARTKNEEVNEKVIQDIESQMTNSISELEIIQDTESQITNYVSELETIEDIESEMTNSISELSSASEKSKEDDRYQTSASVSELSVSRLRNQADISVTSSESELFPVSTASESETVQTSYCIEVTTDNAAVTDETVISHHSSRYMFLQHSAPEVTDSRKHKTTVSSINGSIPKSTTKQQQQQHQQIHTSKNISLRPSKSLEQRIFGCDEDNEENGRKHPLHHIKHRCPGLCHNFSKDDYTTHQYETMNDLWNNLEHHPVNKPEVGATICFRPKKNYEDSASNDDTSILTDDYIFDYTSLLEHDVVTEEGSEDDFDNGVSVVTEEEEEEEEEWSLDEESTIGDATMASIMKARETLHQYAHRIGIDVEDLI